MGRLHAVRSVAVLLLFSSVAWAGLLPSFSPDSCSWNATHIVVVTEGVQIDGSVTVIESWKGDLSPGATLNVPDLAEFEPEKTREIYTRWSSPNSAPPKGPVTGARMILYLVKGEQKRDGRTETIWKPAAGRSQMKVSVAWVELGTCYAHVQVVNPGGQVLVEVGRESELKAATRKLVALRERVEAATALEDPGKRVAALAVLSREDHYLVSSAAFERLGACGEIALPTLRRMLKKSQGDSDHRVLQTLVRAGGKSAGPDLIALLEEELVFWRTRAPSLSSDWWSNAEDMELLRHRYGTVYECLNLITRLADPKCERTVRDTRALWGGTKVLDGSQIAEACDAVLRALKEGPPAEPVYEPFAEEEVAPAPPLEEIPVTTDTDLRLLREREAALAKELEAEHRLSEARQVLRGEAIEANGEAALAEAIREAVPLTYEDKGVMDRYLGEEGIAVDLPESLLALRKRLAPNLARVSKVLAAGRAAEAYRIEKHWKSLAVSAERDAPYLSIFSLRAALMLEAIHALQRGEGRRAARLAVDLWALEEELGRDERLTVEFRLYNDARDVGAWLVSAIIPSLEGADLQVLETELLRLEARISPVSRSARRLRLAWESSLRAWHHGKWDHYKGPLDHLSAQARLSNRRLASLLREWDAGRAKFKQVESALATLPPHRAREAIVALAPATTERWMPLRNRPSAGWLLTLVSWEFDRHLKDLGYLRACRLLAASRRYHLVNGRWPATLREVLGRDPGEKEQDLFQGAPLRLESKEDGSLRVRIRTSLGWQEQDSEVTLAKPK